MVLDLVKAKTIMNFLAHLILAHPDRDLMVGNYLGDLVHKKEVPFVPENFHQGINLHRFIDHFTDNHPSVDQINLIFRPAVGKYAPVASDIVMDYFIYKNWNIFNTIEYVDFEESVYQLLNETYASFPDSAADVTQKMVAGKWLKQYQSIEGMTDVMRRMNRKAKFSVDFEKCIAVMQVNEDKINEHFLCFYEDMGIECQYWINLQNAAK